MDDRLAYLRDHLRREGASVTLDTSATARALYSSDASLYRVVPLAVARPASSADLGVLLDGAREAGVPVTGRGAGTSIAGNAVGTGLVVDLRRLDAITQIDPEARTAVVEPGVVLASLQRSLQPYGLRFGPDPSTASRCTVGGMIGNNACGARAIAYGTTAANLLDADVITGTGDRVVLSSLGEGATGRRLREVVGAHLGTIRTEFGRFGRQLSGYSLEHLLPERRFDVPAFFAGTEGTLGLVTRARLRLVERPAATLLVALGYASMAEAADAVPGLLAFRPTACEGLDRRIVDVVRRRRGEGGVPPLPRGDGWLLVELSGDDSSELAARGAALVVASGALEGRLLSAVDEARALWAIREDGAGLAAVSLNRPAHAGWEDAAVPPDRLGAYLRDFEGLLAEHGLHGLPYGHFGEGCVHVRIDFPLDQAGGVGEYRAFVEDAARLVASHGGSASGEHGDGRARSALLPAMYSPAALAVFGAVKHLFDPANLLNPGVLVDPADVAEDLRVPAASETTSWRRDSAFAVDVHRCTGVGRCVAPDPGGVMCPSFRATGEEKDSTRGRARALQELVNGSLVADWDSPVLSETLDLCLACKGCASDCPTGVDVAAWKARVLDERWRGRIRPALHYTLGRLPFWGRLIQRVPGLPEVVNAVQRGRLGRAALRGAGLDPSRRLPSWAARSASSRLRPGGRGARTDGGVRPSGREVVLWVDSFSDCFDAGEAAATWRVLESAGFAPRLPDGHACCGLTWITTGQLDQARDRLRKALDVLEPFAARGILIVGLEPACLAVWRSDAPRLLDDPRVAVVAGAVRTLAELLQETPTWAPPDLSGQRLVVQPHCHQASVIGFAPDAALLVRTGAEVVTVGGCCGMAGTFGMEAAHAEVSHAVAALDLLPALAAAPDAIVVADGFSCRTQVADLTGRRSLTLAQLLAGEPVSQAQRART